MKIIYYLLFIILFIPIGVFAVVERGSDYYVVDDAHILKKDTISYIKTNSSFLYEKELLNFYVVTITDLDGMEMDEYCNLLFKEYSISDNGLLILVSRGDGLLRIQLGSELGKYITEEMIDEYIELYFSPYIEKGDWNMGIKNGYNAFYKLILDYYRLDSSGVVVLDKVDFKTLYGNYIVIGIVFVIMGLVKLILKMYQNIFVKNKYKDSIVDYFVLALLMGANIVCFIVSYFMNPMSVIILAVVEAVSFYSFTSNALKKFNPFGVNKKNNS